MSTTSESSSFGFRPEHVVDMFLRGYSGNAAPTLAEVQDNVQALLVGPFASLQPDLETIVQEILRRIDVRIGAASVLDYTADHEPWLDAVSRSQWRLWPRLHGYLREQERLPVSVLAELDRSSDQTLERLESPERTGRWDRRGLVVGHVQSGKTTHYISLAAKAIDSGYRIVIILAGMHNSLRSQTHDRIDRQLIGRDSCALHDRSNSGSRLIGVGEYAHNLGIDEVPFSILTCTSAAENGDFKDQTARQVWFQVNAGARLVMVVKKNATILRKLRDWLRMLLAEQSQQESQPLILHPTLFIDDEADQASLNTRDPDQDPSTINGLIRELLRSFARVGFVGYTATPFANIFIDPSVAPGQPRFGDDLFPRSFIISLKAPSDYVGPAVVFGHPGDDSVGVAAQSPLPMYIPVDDSPAWIPTPHRKDHDPGPLPETLRESIRLFLLVCSTRSIRGDDKAHNSMLVHATRFVLVQNRVAEQVEHELNTIRTLLDHGSTETRAQLRDEIAHIWERQICEPHPVFEDRFGDRCLPLPTWEEVWQNLPNAAAKVRVMKINGSSDDALAYSRAVDGLSVIVIGGDKLSRGLTLDGLSVSYFLRTSNMFDTLMQMGRWFGYRPRYADLCRVYTTNELYGSFREIALAVDDLRADLDRMALSNRTPQDFGLRVRSPSDGLLITAANKLRRGESIQVRFAAEIVQALQIPRTGPAARANRDALERLITGLPVPGRSIRGRSSAHFIWHDVNPSVVLDFLTSFEAYRTHSFLNRCEQLRRYIQDRIGQGELTTWTVCVVSKQAETGVEIAGLTIPLVDRGPESEKVLPPGHFSTKQVAGRAEEAVDLTPEQFQDALDQTRELERRGGKAEDDLSKFPAREDVRAVRPPQRGVLLLYPVRNVESESEYLVSAAISFPDSETATPLIYTVNDVWRSEYGLSGDWDDLGQPT